MATNPMQRKARNSFLLGMLVTVLIAGIIVAFLFLQLKNINEELSKEKKAKQKVCVLLQDVASGQILTEDMFSIKEVSSTAVPANATDEIKTTLDSYRLRDKENHPINIDLEKGVYYLTADEVKYVLFKNNEDGSESAAGILSAGENVCYYTNIKLDSYSSSSSTSNKGEKVDVNLVSNAVIAKTQLKANTVITSSLVARADAVDTDDMRKMEYNSVVLPIDLIEGEYVDIRLMLPTGQDFIVISKKMVNIPEVDGEYVDDTIQMSLSEDEILFMSSAIVEAAAIDGSKLYASKYTDAGLQEEAIPTYTANKETTNLIGANPNIVNEAMNKLKERYSNYSNLRNEDIKNAMDIYGDNKKITDKINEAISVTKEERQKYLQSLTAGSSQK